MGSRFGPVALIGLGALLLAWGAFARVWNVGSRPLWQDEAALANAVRQLPAKDLLLQAEVSTPPLFALVSKLVGSRIARPELGLRLLPLLCGILLVPLAYVTARTLAAARSVALAGMSLTASSVMLVIWSREFRHYEIEAFLSTVLALLVFRLRRAARTQRIWPLVLGVLAVCAIGPWIGYGTIFSITALLALLLLASPLRAERRRMAPIALAATGVLVASTLAIWTVVAARQAGSEARIAYDGLWFIDATNPRSWLRAGAYGAISTAMMLFPREWARHIVALLGLAAGIWLLALLGLRTWPRRGKSELTCWTLVPWVLMLLAAVAHRYPFATPRVMVLLAPPLMLALGAGVVGVCRIVTIVFLSRGAPGARAAVALTFLPILYAVHIPLHQRYWVRHEFPEVLAALAQQHQAGECVFVTKDAVPSVRFYAGPAGQAFIYVPLTAGTRPIPRYDYDALVRDTVASAGWRWWVLTTSDAIDPVRQQLFAKARQLGYDARLVSGERGQEDPVFHVAQLYRMDRSGP